MATTEQVTNILGSKYDINATKGTISKGVEYGMEVGENIGNLFNFSLDVLKSKTDKNIDPLAEQREEFLEIINNEELSFIDKIGQINDKYEECGGIKISMFKGIELGIKVVDWIKSLFSGKSE
ncbi:MAG: hypothetical protein IKU37_06580 [Candidatus Gastranaerophilales bacterium]|nr:hypothetical protein [Candidatus Gastranaerophilales bacterium]